MKNKQDALFYESKAFNVTFIRLVKLFTIHLSLVVLLTRAALNNRVFCVKTEEVINTFGILFAHFLLISVKIDVSLTTNYSFEIKQAKQLLSMFNLSPILNKVIFIDYVNASTQKVASNMSKLVKYITVNNDSFISQFLKAIKALDSADIKNVLAESMFLMNVKFVKKTEQPKENILERKAEQPKEKIKERKKGVVFKFTKQKMKHISFEESEEIETKMLRSKRNMTKSYTVFNA